MRKIAIFLLAFTFILLLATPTVVHAAGVVGTGTPASCNEAALDTALVGGGAVTFNCGGAPVTISITGVKNINFPTPTVIDGGDLVTLDSSTFGGHIFDVDTTLELRNIDVVNSVNSAIRARNGSTIITNNVLFSGNNGLINGGAIWAGQATLLIDNTTFLNNHAITYGGAISILGSPASLQISNSTFTNNRSDQYGGAIASANTPVTITNSSFSGHQAFWGGVINFDGATTQSLTISNTTFTGNTAIGTGGAVRAINGTFDFDDATFTNNSAGTNGGAILSSIATPDINNATFTNNTAGDSGGAIYSVDSPATITNSSFTGNHATNFYGGAIYYAGSSTYTLTISNTNIVGHTSGRHGGAIFSADAHLDITSSVFQNNNAIGANDHGGAIYINGLSSAVISGAGTAFTNNGATGQGGAIITGGPLSISDATFSANTALDGGAISVTTDAVFTVSNATFSNNIASNGGAVYHNANTLLTVTNVTFDSNRADRTSNGSGGAIALDNIGSSAEITGSTFTNNLSTWYGGAIYNDSEPFTLTGSTFTNNAVSRPPGFASINGGAILNTVDANNSIITNSTFSGNSITSPDNAAYGGAVANQGNNFRIGMSTFIGNTANGSTLGQGGAFTSSGSYTLYNITFNGNLATGTTARGGAISTGAIGQIINATIAGNLATGATASDGSLWVSGTTTLSNTIVANGSANGTPDNCGTLGGTIVNGGNNIDFNGGNNCGAGFINTDPNLGALTGSPAYFPLNAGSSAVDTGNNASCAAAPVLNQSQNGVLRPVDADGNGTVICDIGSYEALDLVQPTLTSFTRYGPTPNPTNEDILYFQALFDEAVQNVTADDFSVSGGSTATITAVLEITPSSYRLTVSGGDLAGFNGTVGVDLAGGQDITDLAGNALPAGEPAIDQTYTLDNTAPTVTIDQAATQADPTNTSPIIFTAVFSEPVIGFATGDVTLAGTAGATTAVVAEIAPNDGTTYSVTVSGMTSDGTVIATIATGVATDAVGNNNAASTSTDNTVTYDTAGPTVTIDQAATQADPTNASPILFTAVFSEPVIGFDNTDITLSGTAGATNGAVTEIAPNDGTTFEVAVSGMTSDGTVIATVNANAVTDSSGNNNAASTSTDNTVIYDTAGPSVTIDQAATQADPTNTSPIIFTAVFSEPVTGFDNTDVTLAGTAGATTVAVTEIAPNDGTIFEVAVSGMASDGTVIATVNANAAADGAGNNTSASTSTDNTVTYDTSAPTVSITDIQAEYNAEGPIYFNVTFSKPVFDPTGNTDPDDVTNPANYLLVEIGANNFFDTTACNIGVLADDNEITINAVTYDNGSLTAHVMFNTATPLDNGIYRMFVCGTTSIMDLAGNALAGDGTNSGTDHITDFIVNIPDELPDTGFAPGVFTNLPAQPAEKAYDRTGLSLMIPALGVNTTIVGVPVVDQNWDVTWLGSNAGYLNGTAFPTTPGNTVLTGHVYDNNNYPGPFANISSLHYGDTILISAWGKTYTYQVRESKLVSPYQLTYPLQHEAFDWITLVTCESYRPQDSSYLLRRVVRAVLISVE